MAAWKAAHAAKTRLVLVGTIVLLLAGVLAVVLPPEAAEWVFSPRKWAPWPLPRTAAFTVVMGGVMWLVG